MLRAARPEDVAPVYAWLSDPEVARYELMPPQTLGECRDRVRRLVEKPQPTGPGSSLTLIVEHEGSAVGEAMLSLHGRCVGELGWTTGPTYAGRGFATEAARELLRVGFEEYALHRIYAELDARNHASRRVCEKLGLRREVDARDDYWSKGAFTPSLHYALLAQEWR